LTDAGHIPKHIAIIMDGNGRWAESRNMKRVDGHLQGVSSVRRTVEQCAELGLKVLTLFAFSTENWRRPPAEVQFLMDTFLKTLFSERSRIMNNNIRFKLIGNRDKLNERLVHTVEKLEFDSSTNNGMWLILAINYGGRNEIVTAVKRIISKGITPDDINEEDISNHLYTTGLPDPDLIIRTSGEYRLSNFMIWQSAYSELVFVKKYWPDFTEEDLMYAIDEYSERSRRFGRIK
jgi:undecaprenyl diphosphate synthase